MASVQRVLKKITNELIDLKKSKGEGKKVWEYGFSLMLNGFYRISNLRDSVYNKIVNSCSKSLIFTVWSSSSLRRSSSWNLIYCRNLTNRLKISTSVLAKLIYFVVRNKKHRLFWCNTTKLFV
jgi:hypothetical protein